MTKRDIVVIVSGIVLLPVVFFAPILVEVVLPPSSPFAKLVLHGGAVVATTRPHTAFALFPHDSHMVKLLSGSESFELPNGASCVLSSAHIRYRITCRTSPSPAGLYIAASRNVHDIKGPVYNFFLKAQ
jgi:hypothetical protein